MTDRHTASYPQVTPSYQQTTFLDAGVGTVGGIAAGDIDGNGYNEVFVPWFSAGELQTFLKLLNPEHQWRLRLGCK